VGRALQVEVVKVRLSGKKVGKYRVSTILATYDLDVRLDMSANVFAVRVPRTPGEKAEVTTEGVNYETFSAATLEEVKQKVDKFLRARDTTEFEDVIEYELDRDGFGRVNNSVGFDFRVARVSLARDGNDRPKLEVSVEIDCAGMVAVADYFGHPATPQAHSGRYDYAVPYTVERWRKCVVLRDGIAELRRMVGELFGEGGESSAARLDALEKKLLPGGSP
jgi:hypothetical protein